MPRPTNAQLKEQDELHAQGQRRCTGPCACILPVEEFGKQKRGRHGLRGNCKTCMNAQNRESYAREPEERARRIKKRRDDRLTPDQIRANQLEYMAKHRYGITRSRYEAYLANPCAICGKDSEVLDHCHATGKNRAALCHPCNKGLGSFKDNPATLRAAANYLETHND